MLILDCIRIDTLLIWWYQVSLLRSGLWHMTTNKNQFNSQLNSTYFNAASLCDEIVKLWRLAALNPKLSSYERDQVYSF